MKPFLMMIGFLSLLGVAHAREPLQIGEKAPELVAVDQNATQVDFGQLYEKGLVLVYFYPKADTPGCTAEACGLRDAFEELTHQGVQVIGVSTDSPDSQKRFKDKYHLPFTLVADADQAVVRAFGVSTMLGLASRQSFLIRGGVVVWRDLKASTREQARDVLKAVAALR